MLRMEPGQHQCLVFSLAMLLGESVETLLQEIGHSGEEVWWPGWEIPYSYRGIHIQEVIELCLKRNYTLTPIEMTPVSGCAKEPGNYRPIYEDGAERFYRLVQGRRGIMISSNHAVAWDGRIIWDPNGRLYELHNFTPRECWLLDGPSKE